MLVLIAVFLIGTGGVAIVAGSASSNQKSSAATTATPTRAATKPTQAPTARPLQAPAGPAGPTTLFDASGNGVKTLSEFQAPNKWTIKYTYDCSKFGQAGNFAVAVYQGSNPLAVPVNESGNKGDSSATVYNSGSVHLQILSQCDWHVTATT